MYVRRLAVMSLMLCILANTKLFAADFQCPAATEQKDSDINGDITGKAQTLLNIGDAEIQGTVRKTVVDLFSKYPNADRVAIINTLISVTCNFIKNSSTLTDDQKLDRWMAVYPAILNLMPSNKKSQVPDDILQKVTLGETSLDYLTSIIGTPNHVNDYVASYVAGGYIIDARFCCQNPDTKDYPKGTILQLTINIDWRKDDNSRNSIIFRGSWAYTDDQPDSPNALDPHPKLGVTTLHRFQNGCNIASSEGGIMTNSEVTFVCRGGGSHADDWISYEFLMEDRATSVSDAVAQNVTDFSTVEDWISGWTGRSDADIQNILKRHNISDSLETVKNNRSMTYNDKFMEALQPMTVTGIRLTLALGADDELNYEQ
jgi:hypothetical protein